MNNINQPDFFTRLQIVEDEYRLHSTIQKTIKNQHLNRHQDFIQKYLDALKTDINKLLQSFNSVSDGYGDLKTHYQLITELDENMILDASIFMDVVSNEVITSLSYGLFNSFDDFFFRLFCNEEFFSEHSNQNNLWKGRIGGFFRPEGVLKPHTRYYDYRQASDFKAATRDLENQVSIGSFAGGFFSAIPFSDVERMTCAKQMIYYSLLWVYLHEKGHFWNGHLHFSLPIHVNNKSFFNEAKGVSTSPILFNRVFEHQADTYATQVFMDILFENFEENIFIPSYAKPYNKNNYWYIRFAISTIGVVILIFQKSQVIYGQSNSYPSPHSRLLTSIFEIFTWIEEKNPEIISKGTFFESLYCSLRDIYWASQLILDDNDLIDRGMGEHYYSLPKSIEFLENDNELEQLLKFILSGNKEEVDEKIYNKWFKEFFSLRQHLTQNVFTKLREYRKKTNLNMETIFGE